MRSAAIFICLTLFACGDGPPDERAGATTFTPAASGAAVNRVIIEGVADAAVAEGEVVVAIRVEAIERLHGGTLVMTYPDSVISLVEVVPGELVAGGVLVTTLGTGEEVAGELAIGFVLAPSTASAASGTLARVKLSVSGGASGQVAFRAPSYGWESRDRALIAADGVTLAGVRWFGGTATRENL